MDYRTDSISVCKLRPWSSSFRLTRPGQIARMKRSLSLHGQLQCLAVWVSEGDYLIIDGLKRYYASMDLGMEHLSCRIYDIDKQRATMMVLTVNKDNRGMSDYEEGLIVSGLKNEFSLSQKRIAALLGMSRSWVCRRLSLIERLCDSVSDQLRLGVIQSTHARELIKLPRGNQQSALGCIVSNNLTSRQSNILIDRLLKSKTKEQKAYLLAHPLQVLQQGDDKEPYDSRLSSHGNSLLKTLEYINRQGHILTGQLKSFHTGTLKDSEKQILVPRLLGVSHTLNSVVDLIKNIAP